MKNLKFIISLLLTASIIIVAGVFFSSSKTIKQSNNEIITELSTELIQMKKELKDLKTTKENIAVSIDPFLGEVVLFAGNFAPRGWALCHGQLLPIAQNSALFSILGTTYGGDGRTTFGLPDLRGRSAVGSGYGPGLSDVRLGEKRGRESHTLNILQIPAHNHVLKLPLFSKPSGNSEISKGNQSLLSVGNTSNTVLENNTNQTLNTGGNQSFQIRNPYLGMNYIIALQGVFPSRN